MRVRVAQPVALRETRASDREGVKVAESVPLLLAEAQLEKDGVPEAQLEAQALPLRAPEAVSDGVAQALPLFNKDRLGLADALPLLLLIKDRLGLAEVLALLVGRRVVEMEVEGESEPVPLTLPHGVPVAHGVLVAQLEAQALLLRAPEAVSDGVAQALPLFSKDRLGLAEVLALLVGRRVVEMEVEGESEPVPLMLPLIDPVAQRVALWHTDTVVENEGRGVVLVEMEPQSLLEVVGEALVVEQPLIVPHADGVEDREADVQPDTLPVGEPVALLESLEDPLPEADAQPVVDTLNEAEAEEDGLGERLGVPQWLSVTLVHAVILEEAQPEGLEEEEEERVTETVELVLIETVNEPLLETQPDKEPVGDRVADEEPRRLPLLDGEEVELEEGHWLPEPEIETVPVSEMDEQGETLPVGEPVELQALLEDTLPDAETLSVTDSLNDAEDVADAQGDVLAVPQ